MNRFDKINELKNLVKELPITVTAQYLEGNGVNKFLCPFHDDHTPNNLSLNKVYNNFRCYCCGAEGDIITLTKQALGIGFQEAIIVLAYDNGFITSEEKELLEKKQNCTYVKSEYIVTKRERIIRNKATDELLHKVYSIFMLGYELKGKERLSKEHLSHLRTERGLSNKEIKEVGYFTFPKLSVLKAFRKRLLEEGIDEQVLQTVPGFFYNKKTDKYEFSVLKNCEGIGIPIRNVYGQIVGIQIRRDTVEEKQSRYLWFSSSFVYTSKCSHLSYGVSCGTPVNVVYPKELRCHTIYITEGHFKAMQLSNKMNAICLSVQGIGNWKTIPHEIELLKSIYPDLSDICIVYDADIAFNMNVLKQTLSLCLGIMVISLPQEMELIFHELYPYKKEAPVENLYEKHRTFNDFILNHPNYLCSESLYICTWDYHLGKGIDDYLEKHCVSEIKTISFNYYIEALAKMLDDMNEDMDLTKEKRFEYYEKHILNI